MLFIYSKDPLVLKTHTELLGAFTPVGFADKKTLLDELDDASIILIDEDIELAQNIRDTGLPKGIVLLSSHQEDNEKLNFNTYQKPVSFVFLEQKIQMMQKLKQEGLTLIFETSHYQFDAPRREILNKKTGQSIRLTEKETEIIQYLYQNRDRIVSKDELLTDIFGYRTGVETHTVETHIYKLRQKLEDEAENLISTADGGYQLKV